MAAVISRCKDCGAEFVSSRSTSLRCPDCQKARLRRLKKAYKKRTRGKTKATAAVALPKDRVCPYCGRPAPADVYCPLCVEQGYDNLHKEFGMTNGWDKKPRRSVPIVPGNRGTIPSGAINISKDAPYFTYLSNSIQR